MVRATGACNLFAIVVGAFLLVEGLWGLSSPVVFGVLTTNMLHATIHVVLGIVGLWTGFKTGARGFCLFLGGLLVAVGVLWFVPGLGELIRSLLNVNAAVTYLNLVVGGIALFLGLTSRAAVGQSEA